MCVNMYMTVCIYGSMHIRYTVRTWFKACVNICIYVGSSSGDGAEIYISRLVFTLSCFIDHCNGLDACLI